MNFLKNLIIFFKFTNLNKKLLSLKNTKKSKKIILVEFNHLCVQHICFAHLINSILKSKNCSIYSYTGYSLLSYGLNYPPLKKIFFFLGSILGVRNFGIYKSFGTSKFFYPIISEEIELLTAREYKKTIKKIKNKNSLLNLKLNGIYTGDLIYDTFLKSQRSIKPTIDVKSDEFRSFYKDFLRLFYFWIDYFKQNEIEAIIASHSVYTLGLPLRIAAIRNIKSFLVSENYLIKITKKNLHWANETKTFKKIFSSFQKKDQKKYINFAKKKFLERFKGKSSVRDMPYMTSSPYSKNKIKLKLPKKNKIRILITPHDFIDAVHVYGKNIFPDFYDWLKFLANISYKTKNKYEWYIKLHPKRKTIWAMYSDHNEVVLKNMLKKYKNAINILNPNTSHFEIINNKFDFVLTVFGTVAIEYAYFGIKVINASINNPHNNFNFSLNPKNIDSYKKYLLNLEKIRLKINKQEIWKYFFMRNYFTNRNWFFDDYGKMLKDVGYHQQWSYKMYEHWTNNFNMKLYQENMKNVENFISSKDNFFSIKHKLLKIK